MDPMTPEPDSPAPSPKPAARLASLDAYRGFVMFLMAAELLELPQVAKNFPGSAFWQAVKFHSSHVAWTGCSMHDLIQPSFSFMVGVALSFSMASRILRGQSRAHMIMHAVWRSLILVLLGVFLRSIDRPMTYWTFEDTLSQIGLGYSFLFLLGFASMRARWLSLGIVLAGYWLVFALYPPPGAAFDYAAANVPANWAHHFQGFASHWNLNSNAAWAFDRWFLNLFPVEKEFFGNRGGYATLSFIPTLGTMILGLIAGQWLHDGTETRKTLARLSLTGIACLALGLALHHTGLCPSVKKIWTPSWTLFSGGWCLLMMAAFHLLIDVTGKKGWAFPFIVIGMNSIAIYVLVHTVAGFFGEALIRHFGHAPFQIFGKPFEPMLHGAAVLLLLWLILFWMYRRRLFLRI